MRHSSTHSHKTLKKSRSKIMRIKSLDIAGPMSSYDYGKEELDRLPNVGSYVKEISRSTNSTPTGRRSRSSEHPSISSNPSDESFPYYGIEEIVPSRYTMSSDTDFASSNDDRSILVMPILLDTETQGVITKKRQTTEGAKIQGALRDGSFFIQKENYIISNQVRLPQDLIKEGASRIESMNTNQPKLRIPSAVEVVDNMKVFTFKMICAVMLLLVLPLAAWFWFIFKKPTIFIPTKKNVSLLRCFVEYIYDAMLDIYQ